MLLRASSLLALVLALPTAAIAQQESPLSSQWNMGHVSLSAGVSVFERSGSGAAGLFAVRVDYPVYPSLVVEGGLAYARRGNDPLFGDVFIPGVQVQLQGLQGRLAPYAGLGAGMTVERRDGPLSDDLSFAPSFSAGLRAAVTDGVAARLEGRLHGVGANFRGLYSEITGGLSVAW
jgi:hypothetical protein